MNESRIVSFMPTHLVGLKDIEGRLGPTAEAEGRGHMKMGPCATLLIDGMVSICGGIHILWPGTGEAWMSICRGKEGPHSIRVAEEMLSGWIAAYRLDRVQAVTTSGWQEGERTLRFLGFKFESIMRKYGPFGADKAMYARIR